MTVMRMSSKEMGRTRATSVLHMFPVVHLPNTCNVTGLLLGARN